MFDKRLEKKHKKKNVIITKSIDMYIDLHIKKEYVFVCVQTSDIK